MSLQYFMRAASLAAIAALTPLLMPSATTAAVDRPSVDITTATAYRVLSAGERHTVHVRVGLKASDVRASDRRAPLNIALVIDRSGSMSGPRIEAARQAALMAVDRLSPSDIVSVISYDNRAEIEVPATRATDKARIKDRIRQLTPRGSTAIWDGMQASAGEVRKFKSRETINKIILLSDGLANVGPSQPGDFVRLGRSLAQEGITVSTIGLGNGYNEDLMAGLARNAEGTHKFVAEPADLAQFFMREFDDALGVAARDIEIEIDCLPGVVPLKSLSREAEIIGGRIRTRIANLIAGSEHAIVVALEVPATIAHGEQELARVRASYVTAEGERLSVAPRTVAIRFTSSLEDIAASANPDVLRDVTFLVARDQKEEAVRLRDAGRLEEATRKFQDNATYIREQQSRHKFSGETGHLDQLLKTNEAAAAPAAAAPAEWEKTRKEFREIDVQSAGAKVRF